MSTAVALGACCLGGRTCRFRVWAPFCDQVEVHLLGPAERYDKMDKIEDGYHEVLLDEVAAGSLYWYRLDGQADLPDPASRFQPHGVHGPSQVIDPAFPWRDGTWEGVPLGDYIIYEMHVGTFTHEGTFDAIIPHLPRLRDLGVTAVELMPVAQFPGNRNWGYDGVYPFAVQDSYGGPQGLKMLIDQCHRNGLAVVIDVVYNHLGPEGNYLGHFGPYFTDRYKTPWGPAINFDGPCSDEVRNYFVSNALYWLDEFHVDALRLDAVHGIYDFSAYHILKEMADAVHELGKNLGRRMYVIAESDLNDSRLIRPKDVGGFGMDSQWNDDFHHALHTLLTGESDGYYQDFGQVRHLVKALREGFAYSGERSVYRRRRHGNSSIGIPTDRFVVFSQNHDQIGNRACNERLSGLVSVERLKLAAGVVLLAPYIPLLFMGEEYGELAPFPYFISHSDPELIEAVRRGRREEFTAFRWKGEPLDPQDEGTFFRAKLDHARRLRGNHLVLYEFYRELIELRNYLRRSFEMSRDSMEVAHIEQSKIVLITYRRGTEESVVVANLGIAKFDGSISLSPGTWNVRFDSEDTRWREWKVCYGERLSSDGEVSLNLAGSCFLVLIKNPHQTEAA